MDKTNKDQETTCKVCYNQVGCPGALRVEPAVNSLKLQENDKSDACDKLYVLLASNCKDFAHNKAGELDKAYISDRAVVAALFAVYDMLPKDKCCYECSLSADCVGHRTIPDTASHLNVIIQTKAEVCTYLSYLIAGACPDFTPLWQGDEPANESPIEPPA